jgi:hypothetical protein
MRTSFMLALVSLFAFIIVLGALLATPAPGTAQDRPRELLKISGARGHLITQAASGQVLLARDQAAIDALVRAININDKITQVHLILSGRTFLLPAGTAILIINTSWDMSEVRLLDGPQFGRTGWVPDAHIQITIAAPRH